MVWKFFTENCGDEEIVDLIDLFNCSFCEFSLDILSIGILFIFPDRFDPFFEEADSIDLSVGRVLFVGELKSKKNRLQ